MRTIDAYGGGVRVLDSRSTASLLSKVLWITTVAFLFTALGAYIAPDVLGVGIFVLFIVNLGLIFGINSVSRRSPTLALVLMYAFATLMGVEIGPLLHSYLRFPGGQAVVFNAALTTAVGMAAMGMVAQVARFDYRRVANYAVGALLVVIVIGLISSFVHFVSPGIYSWAVLAIFSVLLLVDFMRLRDGGAGLTPVQLSLSIYLDALNIFIALLQIFGNGNGSLRRVLSFCPGGRAATLRRCLARLLRQRNPAAKPGPGCGGFPKLNCTCISKARSPRTPSSSSRAQTILCRSRSSRRGPCTASPTSPAFS